MWPSGAFLSERAQSKPAAHAVRPPALNACNSSTPSHTPNPHRREPPSPRTPSRLQELHRCPDGRQPFSATCTCGGLGRPTVPARMLATLMGLQAFEGLSDVKRWSGLHAIWRGRPRLVLILVTRRFIRLCWSVLGIGCAARIALAGSWMTPGYGEPPVPGVTPEGRLPCRPATRRPGATRTVTSLSRLRR